MICPKCNGQIMDGAKACPLCGTSFMQQPNANLLNQPTKPKSVQIQAAEAEMKEINNKDIVGFLILTIISLIGLLYSVFSSSENSGTIAIWSVIGTVVFGTLYTDLANRKKELRQLLDGKQRDYLCPLCLSPNIKQKFVRASTTRNKSRTRVSKNINPLHPFSYRNYDTKPVTTDINYKNTYTCMNCGHVFDYPKVFEHD